MTKAETILARNPVPRALCKPLILFLSLCLTADGVMAQQVCGPRDAMMARFKADFDEVPVASGLSTTGPILQILASPAGTWSMFAILPNGSACLVTTGTAWQVAPAGRGA